MKRRGGKHLVVPQIYEVELHEKGEAENLKDGTGTSWVQQGWMVSQIGLSPEGRTRERGTSRKLTFAWLSPPLFFPPADSSSTRSSFSSFTLTELFTLSDPIPQIHPTVLPLVLLDLSSSSSRRVEFSATRPPPRLPYCPTRPTSQYHPHLRSRRTRRLRYRL